MSNIKECLGFLACVGRVQVPGREPNGNEGVKTQNEN